MVTTLLAATIAPSPILTPGMIMARIPNHAPSPISVFPFPT
ncbi:Uncharacterised protein [Vibrio cholerae]|nr:Uncharacterised protein [Vibrio cholerae]